MPINLPTIHISPQILPFFEPTKTIPATMLQTLAPHLLIILLPQILPTKPITRFITGQIKETITYETIVNITYGTDNVLVIPLLVGKFYIIIAIHPKKGL